MNRPWQIWLTFAACLGVALVAFGWLSIKALESDSAEALGRQRATQEENVRLALWRMDSQMSPLVAQESALPYFVFNSFYSAQRAYGRMFNDPTRFSKGANLDEFVPSPLLLQPTSQVLLHFQFNPQHQLSSPEVPTGKFVAQAVPDDLSQEQFDQNKSQLEVLKKAIDPNGCPGSIAATATGHDLSGNRRPGPKSLRTKPNRTQPSQRCATRIRRVMRSNPATHLPTPVLQRKPVRLSKVPTSLRSITLKNRNKSPPTNNRSPIKPSSISLKRHRSNKAAAPCKNSPHGKNRSPPAIASRRILEIRISI